MTFLLHLLMMMGLMADHPRGKQHRYHRSTSPAISLRDVEDAVSPARVPGRSEEPDRKNTRENFSFFHKILIFQMPPSI